MFYFDKLAAQFGREWTALSGTDQASVMQDYADARREDNCAVSEYARRIGAGNLQSYANCLRAGKARRA